VPVTAPTSETTKSILGMAAANSTKTKRKQTFFYYLFRRILVYLYLQVTKTMNVRNMYSAARSFLMIRAACFVKPGHIIGIGT
jgi:hypothetical protein